MCVGVTCVECATSADCSSDPTEADLRHHRAHVRRVLQRRSVRSEARRGAGCLYGPPGWALRDGCGGDLRGPGRDTVPESSQHVERRDRSGAVLHARSRAARSQWRWLDSANDAHASDCAWRADGSRSWAVRAPVGGPRSRSSAGQRCHRRWSKPALDLQSGAFYVRGLKISLSASIGIKATPGTSGALTLRLDHVSRRQLPGGRHPARWCGFDIRNTTVTRGGPGVDIGTDGWRRYSDLRISAERGAESRSLRLRSK